MADVFTPGTRRQNWRRWSRVWRRIHDEHRARRASLPNKPKPARIAAFKAWERDVWIPRMKRASVRRNAAMARRREQIPPGPDEHDPHPDLLAEKQSGADDATIDPLLDMDAI